MKIEQDISNLPYRSESPNVVESKRTESRKSSSRSHAAVNMAGLKGNQNCLELNGGSSYARWFELFTFEVKVRDG